MRVHDLSNDALISSLESLVGNERGIVAKVVAYLAEVEERRLHLELACSSMFDFCVRKLGLSEGEAFRRLTAARLVRRFPKLLEAIASGRVLLSSVVLLRDLFTDANVDELVASAAGKSKRAVQELVAKLAPKPDVAPSIRKLPDAAQPAAGQPVNVRPTQAQLLPLSEERYRVQLTASAALREKLERARGLMRHTNPSGDLAVVVEKALDLLIEELEKRKLGKTKRPRTSGGPAKPADVSTATRREVIARDGGQCAYVSPAGERCPAREFLELDHVRPRALGGTGDAENVRLMCRVHNRHAAEQVFGQEYIAKRIRLRQNKSPASEKPEPRELVQKALLSMGFRREEAACALTAIDPATWSRPVETVVRAALDVLT